jgi:D-serine dehydratase
MKKVIAGKMLEQWLEEKPLLEKMMRQDGIFWRNPDLGSIETVLSSLDISSKDVEEAANRLDRFGPYISEIFPETRKRNGIIESAVQSIPNMQDALCRYYGVGLPGTLLLKCDHTLPVSGSIKARGGIYEVLKYAETLALKEGLLSPTDDYACLTDTRFTELFRHHTIVVGSTGNLGLAIGIIGRSLGFNVTVHMSSEAQQWKKDLLRSKGAIVVDHAGDYSKAVMQGRQQAAAEPLCHFVDDENSMELFMGYAVAAQRLNDQLKDMRIVIDAEHPLFVYLPCGVGGAPGGITFGLKLVFGKNVHCFFAEPTHSPSMFLGIYTDKHDAVCVQDFGLDNITEADGLAVGRPSGFVGKRVKNLIDGFYTVSEATFYKLAALLVDCEKIFLEPSAVAGFPGIAHISKHYEDISRIDIEDVMAQSFHLVWATGGSMVPKPIMANYYQNGKKLLRGS